MKLPIFIVNAFTKEHFSGNPAAVVPLDEWLETNTMQKIAAQNNLSETAFIKSIGGNRYAIRWFSPLSEIDFCGHASLASAHALVNHLKTEPELIFHAEAVGGFKVTVKSDGMIEMMFPPLPATMVEVIPDAIKSGLSEQPKLVLRNRQAYVLVYDSSQQIKTLTYDSEVIKKLAPYDVCVTAQGESSDFVSRYFWPANGGDEDPVTGSIHAALVPYWSSVLNKKQLVAKQLSKRSGTLYCEYTEEGVLVAGYGETYLSGSIVV